MFVQVCLLRGYTKSLWYEIPENLHTEISVGTIIKVPFRTRFVSALVEKVSIERPSVQFAIKPISFKEALPEDRHYKKFIDNLSWYQQVQPIHFAKRLRLFLAQNSQKSKELEYKDGGEQEQSVHLTAEQQQCVDSIMSYALQGIHKAIVLHGVTGSGKTEIYKAVIKKIIAQKKTVILLLPEVTLAVQFIYLLRVSFAGSINVLGFHSATGAQEKKLLWKHLLAAHPLVIVGVHLPILLPIANLGLIIVDEEHETGFQEKKHPKINSKDAALMRAALYQIPIVLGSATPSLTSLYNVAKKGWQLLELHKRFSGAFPEVVVTSLRDGKERKQFWITQALASAIQERLNAGEQTILFLNRRGYSFFVQCGNCSYVFTCQTCSVSLTLHENNHLRCHYCSFWKVLPSLCDSCKASGSKFLKKGIGTQQMVSILQTMFPHARIARADMDATVNRKKWQQIVQEMHAGKIDILIGTQTITKGYHFARVTLVGVVWADLDLHTPLYNATEHALQQLIQVAGRAGRTTGNGLVIVQTMSNHPIFSFLNEINYRDFCAQEIKIREIVGYPPYLRLAEIDLKSTDEDTLEKQSQQIVQELMNHAIHSFPEIKILGPALPPVHKIQNMYNRKIYLKGADMRQIISLFNLIDKTQYSVQIFFTPNPVTL